MSTENQGLSIINTVSQLVLDEKNQVNNVNNATANATSVTPVPADAKDKEHAAAYGITIAQLQELREIFSLVDRDGGGTISGEELGVLIGTLGLKASKLEVEAMVKEIDANSDDGIDFDEFVRAMSRRVQTSISRDKLLWAFRKFESVERSQTRHSGKVPLINLINALTHYGDRQVSLEEAEDLVALMAPDMGPNDYFDYEKFLDVMFTS